MKLFLYRLSLTEQEQPNLFHTADRQTRAEFLRMHFSRSFSFDYRKDIKLRYEFIQEDRGIIYAALCRWASESFESDPSDPFVVSEGGQWRKSTFFLNVNDDEQVVAVENVIGVGLPNSILAGVVETVNALSDSNPFRIDAFALQKSGSFNAAVSAYPGPVTSVKFDLVVPNPIDSEGETKAALKKLRERTGAERIGERLQSDKGLKTENPYIQEIVDYAESGGGDVTAKSGQDEIYNSKKTIRSTQIPDDLRPTGSLISSLYETVVGHLKR